MISINDLTFLKKCGLHLTAINPETKKPVDKSGYGKWVEWTPKEIIKHNICNIELQPSFCDI